MRGAGLLLRVNSVRMSAAGSKGAAAPRRHSAAAQPALAAAADAPAPGQPAGGDAPVVLQYERLVPAQLLRRYKRFLGDVQLSAGSSDLQAGPEGEAPAGSAEGSAKPASAAEGAALVEPPEAADGAAPGPSGAAAEVTIHVPNTGPMTGLLDSLPAAALLSVSANPQRKHAHTLEWLRPGGQGSWVGTHSAKANAMVRALLEARLLTGLPPYGRVQPEVKYGADGKSRCDFLLHPAAVDGSSGASSAGPVLPEGRRPGALLAASVAKGKKRGRAAAGGDAAAGKGAAGPAAAGQQLAGCTFVEVKSVTLAEDRPEGGGRIALFPDTVSERAQRHVTELTALARAGGSAALVFVVQRDDCRAFAPCHEKDPRYGRLVREAAAAGVLLLPVVCALDEQAGAVRFLGTLPVELDYKWAGDQ